MRELRPPSEREAGNSSAIRGTDTVSKDGRVEDGSQTLRRMGTQKDET